MKKIHYFFMTAAFAFAMVACGSNTDTKDQDNSNEPTTEESVAEEPVVEEPAPAEPEVYDHWDWSVTLPAEGWDVFNGYSDMGISKPGEKIHFNIKDWKDTSIEKCVPNLGCLEENRQEDVTVGGINWTVYSNAGDYNLMFITFDPTRNMVVRIGVEDVEDLQDARLMTVLEGFAIKPVE